MSERKIIIQKKDIEFLLSNSDIVQFGGKEYIHVPYWFVSDSDDTYQVLFEDELPFKKYLSEPID